MYITEVSIKRPATAAVFSLLIIVFGLYLFFQLPVRELPKNIQNPVVSIKVNYSGASADIISSEIIEPLEDVVGAVEGTRHITSKAQTGVAEIKIEFETSIDLDDAANDVREKIARVVDNLPEDASAPQILKQSHGFSTTAWIAITGSKK